MNKDLPDLTSYDRLRQKYSLSGNCLLSPTGQDANGEKIEIHRRKRVAESLLPEYGQQRETVEQE